MVKVYAIYVRCTKDEKENIKTNAKINGMKISEFIRTKGLEFQIPQKDTEQMELIDFLGI